MDKQYSDSVEYPNEKDNNDPIGHFRQRFYLEKGVIYMCGNSLGLMCKDAEEAILSTMNKWKQNGVKIWNIEDGKYYLYSEHLAELMAPIVGAEKDEVTITGSTTVNIHQAMATLYKPTQDKYKIIMDDINFPTDRYAVESQVKLNGYDPKQAMKVVRSREGRFLDEDDVIAAMSDDVALILLSTVYYRTAQVVDMKKITRAARKRNIIIGWDMCHAVGALEIDLKSLNCDFAVWCTYKYLNGGPGAVAALYVNRRHFAKTPGLAGWFGNKHETQFLLKQEFDHQQDACGWQIGSPSILSMAALEGSLKIFKEAGLSNIRKKSLHITGYMIYLVEKKLITYGYAIGSFKEDSKRGGHVCLEHHEAYRISLALKARNVVPDFREPNVIRLTPAALYTRYEDVYKVVDILEDIAKTESYKEFSLKRKLVV